MPIDINVDRSSPVPLYYQVAEQFEAAISSGRLKPGARISNEISLAQDLGLSRPTMRQAIQLLVDKGMLVRKRGVGTQVVQGEFRRSVELTSLYDDLSSAGKQPSTSVLEVSLTTASDDVAHRLDLTPGQSVWHLRRIRCVADEPLAIMENWLPESVLDLTTVDLSQVGLYQALRRAGRHLRVAKQRIGARTATAEEGRLLEVKRGAALVTMTRTSYDDAGVAVEYGDHVYRCDLYAFEVTLVDR